METKILMKLWEMLGTKAKLRLINAESYEYFTEYKSTNEFWFNKQEIIYVLSKYGRDNRCDKFLNDTVERIIHIMEYSKNVTLFELAECFLFNNINIGYGMFVYKTLIENFKVVYDVYPYDEESYAIRFIPTSKALTIIDYHTGWLDKKDIEEYEI